MYFKLVIAFSKKYNNYPPAKNTLCVLFANLIFDLLVGKSSVQSKNLIDILMKDFNEFTKRPATAFYKIIYRFYEGAILIVYDDQVSKNKNGIIQGELKARMAIAMLNELEQDTIATIYQRTLEEWLVTAKS